MIQKKYFRMSLGLLLSGFVLIAAFLAVLSAKSRATRRSIENVEAAGGSLRYGFQYKPDGSFDGDAKEPEYVVWLRKYGIDLPPEPTQINFAGLSSEHPVDDALLQVASFGALKVLTIERSQDVTDR